jgi:NAD(P)H dehydrogenase (quinone)
MNRQIVIVYHSGYGHTRKVAEAVAAGSGGRLLAIDAEGNLPAGGWEQLAAADAIVFGSPTYMGSVSWQFKKFADASSKPWYGQQWKNKLAAGFTNSASMNGDKLSTLHYFFTLSQQHSMLWVGTGMMPSNSKAAKRDDINFVASSSGLMTATPSDASPDEMVAGDIATARQFGQRVAAAAALLIAPSEPKTRLEPEGALA